MEITNCPIIYIKDSLFINGSSFGINKKRRFSGNAGAVAIGYNDTGHLHDIVPNITISGSSFHNNAANTTSNFITIIDVLVDHVYNQRGGGMAFYFGENNYSGFITVESCEFNYNYANDSGGGIYMFLSGHGSSQTVVVSNTNFTGNFAQYGGGLEITHFKADSLVTPNNISVINCRFNRNLGDSGGGYNNIQLNHIANLNYLYVLGSVFEDNMAEIGAGLYLESAVTVTNITLPRRIVVENWLVLCMKVTRFLSFP